MSYERIVERCTICISCHVLHHFKSFLVFPTQNVGTKIGKGFPGRYSLESRTLLTIKGHFTRSKERTRFLHDNRKKFWADFSRKQRDSAKNVRDLLGVKRPSRRLFWST